MPASRFPITLLPLLLLVGACTTPRPVTEPASTAVRTNENLNSVLWTQTAAEYAATAIQAYQGATVMLDRALADSTWTAALEQLEQGDYHDLPPAVILDVDETVLDNSAYQARLVQRGTEFSRDTWQAWVREERAAPVPGALAFTQYADERGVTVFYVTNRRHEVEPATRDNLAAWGFPLSEDTDRILTRAEQPDWTGEKETRRAAVAQTHRIVLLLGDNLGDFVPDVDVSVAERADLTQQYAEYWGTRWFVLPNPQYGSWDGALIDYEYGLSRADKLQRKYDHLDAEGHAPASQ
jgi:acid phosphatase